jgi:mannose-6-phosphate isomerase class I
VDVTPERWRYEPLPSYPAVAGAVDRGFDVAVGALLAGPAVLAVDGPHVLDWATLVAGIRRAAARLGTPVETRDVRDDFAPWSTVRARTSSAVLRDDPDFETIPDSDLSVCFDAIPAVTRPLRGLLVVFGPGAALLEHDVLWYADLPKRFAEAAVTAATVTNLGQREGDGSPSTKRLFYVDWPLLDRHRDRIAGEIARWIDTQDDADNPTSLDGACLRRTLESLAEQPLRTRPTFNTTSWGGHWGQRALGMNPDARNTALGYELIAPESGLLIGGAQDRVEVPFQLLVGRHPREVMGEEVTTTFGTSFPVRFDYLDTVDGGNLSVHCHPQERYMRDVFGWPYTQHETYYLMVAGEERRVFLGLRDDVDVDLFEKEAQEADRNATPFDIERHVQVFPAEPHQLFLIPAGTPHGSGEGNVVLEVSATPYLYSLRFYDWLRRDADDRQRPVHVDHAFDNLDRTRRGEAVGEQLLPQPRTLRDGPGWREELLGALPEMFFEVRRLVLDAASEAPDDTAGRFHVLNVVEGSGVTIETADGYRHPLAYAESLLVPAAVGRYTLRRHGDGEVRVVKALVR